MTECLQPVWKCFVKKEWSKADVFKKLGQYIRDAKEAEKKGIDFIKIYLNQIDESVSETP